MCNAVKHYLKCLLVIHISCSKNSLFSPRTRLLTWLFAFAMFSCFSFFAYSRYLSPFRCIASKYFLPFQYAIDSFLCCTENIYRPLSMLVLFRKPTEFCLWFYASAPSFFLFTFFLLWLCSRAWNQVWWSSNHSLYFSGLLYLCGLFCNPIRILRLFFLCLRMMELQFWFVLHWICRLQCWSHFFFFLSQRYLKCLQSHPCLHFFWGILPGFPLFIWISVSKDT